MKKFLSIFIAVAMVLSFAGMFGHAPVAKAAAGLDRAASGYSYIDPYPGDTSALVQNDTTPRSVTSATDDIPIYTMGVDYIDGTADDGYDTVELRKTDGTTVVQTSNIAANTFRLPTDNVDKDGAYGVWEVDSSNTNADTEIGEVFIKYNMSVDQTSLDYCKPNYISGYVKHGDGTGATGAAVAVLYPDGDYLVYATVDTHGQFGMTIGPNNDGVYERGVYSIAVIDDYPSVAAGHNGSQVSTADDNNDVDAFIYKQLYTTTLDWTLDTYVNPTILYESAAGTQSFVLKLFTKGTDENPSMPVDNEAGNFTLTGFTETSGVPVKEISPGFYRFVGTVDSGETYVKVEVNDTIGGVTVSASKTLAVSKLTEWNPQVVVDAHYSIDPYGEGPYCQLGRDVYDKLPCTVGNSLEIYPILYEPEDSAHYKVHSWSATVSGPVTFVDDQQYLVDYNIEGTNSNIHGLDSEGRYLVNASGTISVDFSGTLWRKANYDCETFDALNACCVTPEDVHFDICSVSTCTVGTETEGITQTKNDDGTYDITIPISGDPNKVVNCELCDQIVAHIYTIDDVTDCKPNGDLNLWYNPLNSSSNPDGTGIDDLPIAFEPTNVNFVRDGNKLIVKGVDLSGLCDDIFVVQVFGTETRTECGTGTTIVHPLIYEKTGDITSPLNVTSISATADVDTLVAGVCQKITVSAPDFSGTPSWKFLLNGSALSGSYSMVDMGDGTYVLTLDPALSSDGTFEIVGDYQTGCDVEEAVVDITVELPTITTQIGLIDHSDGSVIAVIDNDEIITEGITEYIYVTATDPRDGSAITLQDMSVSAVNCDCDIPSSIVCGSHPEGCEGISPLSVTGFDNPNVSCDPQFDLYITACGAEIYVDTFTLVPPTVKADPEVVPVTNPATATHVTFTVTDAHGHGAVGIPVTLGAMGFSSGAAGYGWSANAGTTGTDGEVDWMFVPPNSGKFTISAISPENCFYDKDGLLELPCGWENINTSASIEAKYQAPVVDTEAPVITLTAPEDGATVDTDMVTVKGTVTDNVGVTSLYIGSMKVDFAPDGSFSADCALSEGENTLKLFAFDAANNKAEKDITVTYKPVKKTVVTVQIGSDVMKVNGEVKQLDAIPVIHAGHTYLPLRAIVEALGAKVDWNAETKGIVITLGSKTVGLQIGNVSAVVNGNVESITFAPYLQPYGDGTYAATMVPLRAISEGLGADVDWDPTTRVVTITLVQP